MGVRCSTCLLSLVMAVAVALAGPVPPEPATPVRRVILRFTLPYDPKVEGYRGMRHQAATSNDVYVRLGALVLQPSLYPIDAFEPELHEEGELAPAELSEFRTPGVSPLLAEMRVTRRLPDGLRVGDLDGLSIVTDDSWKPFLRLEAVEVLVSVEPSGKLVALFGGPLLLGRRFSEAFGDSLSPVLPSRPDTGTGEPLVLELSVEPGTEPGRSTLTRSMAWVADGAVSGRDAPYVTGLIHLNVGSLDWPLGTEFLVANIPVAGGKLLRFRLPVPSWFRDEDVRLLELARVFHQASDPFTGDAITASLSPEERREQARWPERVTAVRLLRRGRVLREVRGGLADRGAEALIWRDR